MADSFPRRRRLRKHRDYQRVQSTGEKLQTGPFIMLVARVDKLVDGAAALSRVGFTVSRRVGNAVVRNRIKRLLREAFRRRLALFPAGLEIVVIATPRATSLSAAEVASEVDKLCKRCRSR